MGWLIVDDVVNSSADLETAQSPVPDQGSLAGVNVQSAGWMNA